MSIETRTPSAGELAKERAFLLTVSADTAITLMLILVAIASGSLTMLGEAIRGALMLTVVFYTLWLLRSVHRGRLTDFEFGTGKVEQFAWVIVGLSLVFGGLWVAQRVFHTVVEAGVPASPLGLAFAAIINAVNLIINIFGWVSMRAAAKGADRGILGAELSARFGALVGSAILQVTLTIAALAKDPALVILFDALGATLVVLLMLRRGIGMVLSGLASLFDRPAPHNEMTGLRTIVESTLPPGCLVGLRTRRGGDRLFVEVGVDAGAFATLENLNRHVKALERAFADLDGPVDLTVVPR